MLISAVLSLTLILTRNAEAWRMKRRTSEWTFHMVRRPIDTSVVVKNVTSESLTGCAAFCSNLDSIVVPSLYFIQETGECACNSETDGSSEEQSQPEIVYGTRETLEKTEHADGSNMRTIVWPYKPDCSSLHDSSYYQDGVYMINPPGGLLTDTWCDMANGGWTVIQRRVDGSENFYRDRNDYVNGFGNRTGEFWLGLENIHHLTKAGSQLTVYMEGYPGVTPPSMTANYSHFTVDDNASEYTLYVSGFSGTCGDSFAYANGQRFTTFDNDNDDNYHNCAALYTGAWWYNSCHMAHLNGIYYKEGQYVSANANGIHWKLCWNFSQSSRFAIMKVMRHTPSLSYALESSQSDESDK